MTTRILTVLAVAASAACAAGADGPPEVHLDRTACSHCGMFVSELAYAAAYRAPGADARVFDDIQCLLDAARQEPNVEALRFWFHDAARLDAPTPAGTQATARGRQRETWIDGREAVFVSSPSLRTPMGGGVIAYRNRAAAQEGAARHQGSVIDSLKDLRSRDLGGHRGSGHAR